MGDFCFSKAILAYDRKVIIVFEHGNIGKPICVLTKRNIEELNEEWKKKGLE